MDCCHEEGGARSRRARLAGQDRQHCRHRILRRLAATSRRGEEPAEPQGDHVAWCWRRCHPEGPDTSRQHPHRACQRPGPDGPHDRIHRAARADASPPAAAHRREPEEEAVGLLPHPCREGPERRHHGNGRDGCRFRDQAARHRLPRRRVESQPQGNSGCGELCGGCRVRCLSRPH